MDDPGPSFRDILARHQENAGAASVVALLFSVVYAVFKRLEWRKALMAAGAGSLVSGVLWIFFAEWLHPTIVILLPWGVGCGLLVFPLLSAWVAQDDQIAKGVVSGAGGLLARLAKRFTGGP